MIVNNFLTMNNWRQNISVPYVDHKPLYLGWHVNLCVLFSLKRIAAPCFYRQLFPIQYGGLVDVVSVPLVICDWHNSKPIRAAHHSIWTLPCSLYWQMITSTSELMSNCNFCIPSTNCWTNEKKQANLRWFKFPRDGRHGWHFFTTKRKVALLKKVVYIFLKRFNLQQVNGPNINCVKLLISW